MKQLSVYIHIPFCVQKCRYCDFLSAPADDAARNTYMSALKREIENESESYKEFEIITVFFGGGTPSILNNYQIADIIKTLRDNYNLSADAEITIEMNPGTATFEKLEGLKRAGVNRLSIGLQSTVNEELKMLGRIHTFETFLDTYNAARKAGFNNINIDLMSALPGQTRETWNQTLYKIVSLNPEHISAYSLIIEEGTYLYDNLDKFPEIPSEEEDRQMYLDTKEILKQNGYHRYEISNYAKEGYECRHNKVYWTRDNYVGFGLGASSMVEDKRWKNIDAISSYINNVEKNIGIKEEIENLEKEDCMSEFIFLGLRMMQGVNKNQFYEIFNVHMKDVFKEPLEKWTSLGMLKETDTNVILTDEGIDISNQIFVDFCLD